MSITTVTSVVTPSNVLPISVEFVKLHSRINSGDSEDDLLEILIKAAAKTFTEYTDGRVIMSATYRQHMPAWPTSGPIEIKQGEVSEVIEVSYYDEDDVEVTLEDWSYDANGIPCLVYLTDGSWPALSSTRTRPIAIEYEAGYLDAGYIDSDIQLGLAQLVEHWYLHRSTFGETDLKSVPMGFEMLCERYKTGIKGY